MKKFKFISILLLLINVSTACTNRTDMVSEIKSNETENISKIRIIIDKNGPFFDRIASQFIDERLRYVGLSENKFELYGLGTIETKHTKIGNLTARENEELRGMLLSDVIRNVNMNDGKNVYFETSVNGIEIMKSSNPVEVIGKRLSSIGIVIEEYKGFTIVYPCNRNICSTDN